MRTPLALTALVIAAIADVSSGTPTHYVVNTRDASIAIRTFQFSPDTLRVKRGTRVVWSNADEIEHTITSGTPAEPDNRFGGVVDKRGATYAATLEKSAPTPTSAIATGSCKEPSSSPVEHRGLLP